MAEPAGAPRAPARSGRQPAANWLAALTAMERQLDEIHGGLAVGELPAPYAVAVPPGPPPAALADRARALLAVQREAEMLVRDRLGFLATVISGSFPAAQPVPVFLDRRS